MSTLDLLVTLWLFVGLGTAVWFHIWRGSRTYAVWWHMPFDYLTVVACGPVGLAFAVSRAWRERRVRRRGQSSEDTQ